MQAQHPSGSGTEAITNSPEVGDRLSQVGQMVDGRMKDIKSYSVPGLVDSSLNPTLHFVTLADYDTLQLEVEQLRRFMDSIKQTCENPQNRGRRTQLQMCKFLDEVRLTAIGAGSDDKWGSHEQR
jgi:cell division protein ZapA (FtsZ GTPase activity inhibitor)